MNRKVLSIAVLAGALTWACGEPAAGPDATLRPSLMADGVPEDVGPYGVGHTMIQVVHTGSAGERRPLDVHVWYPAHPAGVTAAPRTAYRSRLFGVPLVPGTYDPLTFTIPSPLAHEGADIDARGPRFPLLIWSHGSGTDALDHAFTAEAIASHGFVVASAEHTNNSQDDALVDYINQLVGSSLLACLDALQPPCGGEAIGTSVKNRVRDVSALIDEFTNLNAARFGSRIDVARVGVIGHSRGMLTAMAAVAGSSALGIPIEPRIDAIMTMSSGRLTFAPAEMAAVRVPILMMAGASDETQPVPVVRAFFDMLSSNSRLFVVVRDAEHLSFGSALCARMQAAGGVRLANPRAILEDRTVRTLLTPTVATFGSTLDYCSYDAFVEPVDIRPLVQTITGVDVTESNVPRTQDAREVSRLSVILAVSFFNAALDEQGADGLRFTRYLTPRYLMQHEPNVLSAETILRGDATCPEGQGCTDGRRSQR